MEDRGGLELPTLVTIDVRQYGAGVDDVTLFTILIPFHPNMTSCGDLADGVAYRLNLQRQPPANFIEVVDLFIAAPDVSSPSSMGRSTNFRNSPKYFFEPPEGQRWAVGFHAFAIDEALARTRRATLCDHVKVDLINLKGDEEIATVSIDVVCDGKKHRTAVSVRSTVDDLLRHMDLPNIRRVLEPRTGAAISPLEVCGYVFPFVPELHLEQEVVAAVGPSSIAGHSSARSPILAASSGDPDVIAVLRGRDDDGLPDF